MATENCHGKYFRSEFLRYIDKYFKPFKDEKAKSTDNPNKATDKKESKLKGTFRWHILLNNFKYEALNNPQYEQYMRNIEEDLKKTNDLLNNLLQPSNLAKYRESALLLVFESIYECFKYLIDFTNTLKIQITYPNIPEYCLNMIKSIHKEKKSHDKMLMDHVSTNIHWIVQLLLNNGCNVNSTDRKRISVLQYASYYCSLKTIEYLVEHGADINAKDKYNQSVLHYACMRNTIDVVQYLVERGADINDKDINSSSVLHGACEYNTLDVVQYLVQLGLDINDKNNENKSVLHNACNHNTLDIIQYLVEGGADINPIDTYGSVLHYACVLNTLDVVQYLVQLGLDINAKDKYSKSLLHYACELNTLNVVQYLVGQGVDIHAKDKYSKSVLHYACELNTLNVVQYLVEQGVDINAKDEDNKSVLHFACERNTIDVIQYLVARGADINAKDKYNKSVLHCASECNTLNVVQYLVTQGADIHAKCTCAISVLHYSCIYNSLDVVQYLVERGEDINAKDKCNRSVLHHACARNSLDVVKYLVERGIDINANDADNKSGLHYACEHNSLDVVQYLVEQGADINAEDEDNKSMLHLACVYNTLDIIQYLVAQGADINSKDYYNESVLHCACMLNTVDVVQYLVDSGADVNAIDNDGNSVEMIAVKRDIEILKCIKEAQNGNRKSALHIAIKLDKLENFKYIFTNDCKVNLLEAVKYNRKKFVDFILKFGSAEVTVELIYASIQNESLSMLQILINKIDGQKLLSITSYKESIWEIANRQQCAEIINFLSEYFPAVENFLNKTPSGRDDECSLPTLRMVNEHCNIFNAQEYAGAGTHRSEGERTKNHGTEFMTGNIFLFLLNIYKDKFQCKISCENSNYGKFDDLVINANYYLMCLQFKSKFRINENTALSPIRQTDLFGNKKNSNFDMYKYFESFLENVEKFTNNDIPFYLILYTNQPLDDDLRSCMVEDRSVPLLNNIYKLHSKTLRNKITEFHTRYSHEIKSIYDPKQIIELFFKNIYFAVNQLDLKNLDNKITGLLKELISKEHVDDIYSVVKGQLGDWYKPDNDKSGVYFSEKSILFYFDSIKNKFSDKQQRI